MAAATLARSKLTYFGIPGRGEAIRLCFVVAGVEFEDDRVAFPEWSSRKSSAPFGSVPILTLPTGETISNQRAILRFLGKKFDIYPTHDDLVAARVDEIMDAIDDLSPKTNNAGQGLQGEEKLAARAAAAAPDGVIGVHLQNIDNFIAKHGSGGFAVGTQLSVADLMLFSMAGFVMSGFFDGVPPSTIERYSNIQAVRKTVANHAAVRAYYEGREQSANEDFLNNQRD